MPVCERTGLWGTGREALGLGVHADVGHAQVDANWNMLPWVDLNTKDAKDGKRRDAIAGLAGRGHDSLTSSTEPIVLPSSPEREPERLPGAERRSGRGRLRDQVGTSDSDSDSDSRRGSSKDRGGSDGDREGREG